MNFAGNFLAGYGWMAFVCFIYLVVTWVGASPVAPDPGQDLLYPHNEHGRITYFSAFQATSCYLLFLTSIPLFFVGTAIIPKKNVKVLRGPWLSISSRWDPDDPEKVGRWGMLAGMLSTPALVFGAGPVLVRWLNSLGVVLWL
jgi:hypothetical protein